MNSLYLFCVNIEGKLRNHTTMSSSSSRPTSAGNRVRGLQYQYKMCNCRRKAKVKIVESENPSKGMLYFVCEKDECGFFSWCNPIYRDEPDRDNYIVSQPVQENSYLGGVLSKLENLDNEMKNLKLLVGGCVMVSIFLFYCC